MTGIALRCRTHMRRRLDLRIDRQVGTAVAGRAVICGTRGVGSRVIHPGRRKGREIGMAGVAGGACGQVSSRLAHSLCPVVAGHATTGCNARMVERRRLPGHRSMAVVAGLRAGGDMGHRACLGILGDVTSVMTGQAIPGGHRAGGSCMIHGCGQECGKAVVTGRALRCRRYMRGWLGLRIDVGVAPAMAGAAIGQTGVIHGGRPERGVVGMAGIALRCRRYVRGRLRQPRTARPVAGIARAHCICRMREGDGRPGRRRAMAGVALRGSRHMRHRLGLRIAGYVSAAMAGSAIACRSGMVHAPRRERHEAGMAGIAGGRRRYVIGERGFADGRSAVMARLATTDYRWGHGRMVESGPRPRRGGLVAGIALRRGRYVRQRLRQGIDRRK